MPTNKKVYLTLFLAFVHLPSIFQIACHTGIAILCNMHIKKAHVYYWLLSQSINICFFLIYQFSGWVRKDVQSSTRAVHGPFLSYLSFSQSLLPTFSLISETSYHKCWQGEKDLSISLLNMFYSIRNEWPERLFMFFEATWLQPTYFWNLWVNFSCFQNY